MIYLITGVPGSGKTLMAVGKFIPSLMDDISDGKGGVVQRRLMVDGIPSLALMHEPLSPTILDDKQAITVPDGHGFGNWMEWAKPGDLIVVDEVQRICRPRPAGSKVPPCISMLETHRHFGIDMVLITQNPGLIDANIRKLVGRHLHVRRIFGGARAMVYEWDGCQSNTQNVKGATKSIFKYPKEAFSLYKSSELHIKQRHKIPLYFAIPFVVLVLAIIIVPIAYQRVNQLGKTKDATHDNNRPGQNTTGAPGSSGTANGVQPVGMARMLTGAWIGPYPLDHLIYSGEISMGETVRRIWWGMRDGEPIPLTDEQIIKWGATISALSPCAVLVAIDNQKRVMVCDRLPAAMTPGVARQASTTTNATAAPTAPGKPTESKSTI